MDDPRTGFLVEIQMHTEGARRTLTSPERVRFLIGEALDLEELVEEVDFTITVDRAMPMIRGSVQ